jgi:CubicO group peptidase (beta-lactamase class C family)
LLRAAAAAPLIPLAGLPSALPAQVEQLFDRIEEGMARFGIPGAAAGLLWRGQEYVRGFGVTDLADPRQVDGDTVFRVASTTKTFTGTAAMRLVERGRLDLDRRVRSYLPSFRTSDPAASARVTVREVFNHSGGWLGDFFLDTGSGDDALERYVAAMAELPQLTSPGSTFAYNNAALALAGRLIEVATGRPYEKAARSLVLEPLRLAHTGYSLDELPGVSVAVPHVPGADGEPVSAPQYFPVPRSFAAFGGLISSARDQLRWAQFHLGDGGSLLTPRSMRLMKSHPGPGGTLFVELDGVGVTWMIRPTAEGPKVIQHGGDLTGEHSGFLMVPDRRFALTVLTNSETGPALLEDLFAGDWALRTFAGVSNLPAVARKLSDAQLAEYVGGYSFEQINVDGTVFTFQLAATADNGQLSVTFEGQDAFRLAFYRKDYALILQPDGTATDDRANFVRGPGGVVTWLRYGGRLLRHGPVAAGLKPGAPRLPSPSTLPHLLAAR